MNEVLHKSTRVIITRIGRGKGVAVSLKNRDGWSIRREWATRQTAISGHENLAKERFWEGASHLEVVDLLRGKKPFVQSFN